LGRFWATNWWAIVTDVIFVTGSCTFLHFFLNSGYNVVIGCNCSNCFPKSGCIFLQLDVLFLCFLHSEVVKGLRCIFFQNSRWDWRFWM
jgi:hypothetical protein